MSTHIRNHNHFALSDRESDFLSVSFCLQAREHRLAKMGIINKSKVIVEASLKRIIGSFSKANGKFFYSIEVTPKDGLKIDFNKFRVLPLFVDITWIGSQNLHFTPMKSAPAFELASEIRSSQVVNSITCYTLSDEKLDEILSISGGVTNYTILRGGENCLK